MRIKRRGDPPGDPRHELLSRLDGIVARLEDPALLATDSGWTAELATRYAAGFRDFRERILAGATTEQDKTLSWGRALDFEGLNHGDVADLAWQIDHLRARYFA